MGKKLKDAEQETMGVNETLRDNSLPSAVLYTQLKYEFPICNYTCDTDDDNLGWAIGVTVDGVPFAAELFDGLGDLCLGIIIPAIFEGEYNPDPDLPDKLKESASPMLKVEIPRESRDNSVLDIGMVDYGQEDDFDYIVAYADYICDAGLVKYTTNVKNASVFYRADQAGNILAKILVTLIDGGEEAAFTDLEFQRFSNHGKPDLKIVE